VLPFALLVFLVWAMACGETWALPVSATVASFLAQTHVGFMVLALPLFGIGAAWLVATRRRAVLRTVALTAALLVVLWLPVLVDLVTGTTGNIATTLRWFRDADEGIHTPLQGWRLATAQLALPPEWLVSHREPFWLTGEPAALYRTPVPWLLAPLAVAAWWFRRTRHPDGGRFVTVLACVVALTVVAVWRTVGLAFDYRLRWTWIVGMVAAVVIAYAASTWRRGAVMVIAAAAVVGASAVSTVVALRAETPHDADSAVLAALLPDVLDAVGGADGQVVVHNGGYAAADWYARSLVLELERRGIDARMPSDERAAIGSHRVASRERPDRTLLVGMDEKIAELDADPRLRRVASWSSVTAGQRHAHERLVARLDRDVAAGRMEPVERALVLHEEGLQVHDDAVAWAVAVYLEQP
jgi:hypothetical protein